MRKTILSANGSKALKISQREEGDLFLGLILINFDSASNDGQVVMSKKASKISTLEKWASKELNR